MTRTPRTAATPRPLHELRQLLTGVASEQGTLPYAGLLKAFDLQAPAMQRLVAALETLQWQDAALGRPQLVSVVVQKRTPCPRAGFFRQARLLGLYDGPDSGAQAEMWHQDQLEKAWEHYRPVMPAGRTGR